MRKIAPVVLASLTAGALFASPALAGQTAYVAATSQVSPGAGCPATAPCLTLAAGYAALNAGGELVIMDGATYNESIDVTKSVSVVAANRPVIVPLPGQAAFNMNTGGVNLSLNGVIIDGAGTNANAINFFAGKNLFLTDSNIRNFSGGVIAGIYVKPPAGGTFGLYVSGSGISGTSFGIIADGTLGGAIRGSIRSSSISTHVNNALTLSTAGSGSAVLLLHQVLIQGNGFGIATAGTGAGLLVDDSRIFANTTGISATGGSAVLSYGNNNLNANGTDGSFTGTIAPH